jgi:Zn finger protein HypA/HybF involved in hydrogenase expression
MTLPKIFGIEPESNYIMECDHFNKNNIRCGKTFIRKGSEIGTKACICPKCRSHNTMILRKEEPK